MLQYVPVQFPDACTECQELFGDHEQRVAVLVSRGVPQGTPSELGALYEPRAYHVRHAPPPGTPGRVVGGPRPEHAGRPRRSNALAGDHFAQVAAVYRDALHRRFAPTHHVALVFGISKSTAGKWVMECRQLGLLPPTAPGKAAA